MPKSLFECTSFKPFRLCNLSDRYLETVLLVLLPVWQWLASTTSHINYWDQLNSFKNFWKFWNGPHCRNKSGPSPLLKVAAYWQSSNTEACAKKLSQILANNIDNVVGWIDLIINVRCCRVFFMWKLSSTDFSNELRAK